MVNRLKGLKYFLPHSDYLFLVRDKYSRIFGPSFHDQNKTFYLSKKTSKSKSFINVIKDENIITFVKNNYSFIDRNVESYIVTSGYYKSLSVLIIPSLSNPKWFVPIENYDFVKKSKFVKPTKFKSIVVYKFASFIYTIKHSLIKFIFPFEASLLRKNKSVNHKEKFIVDKTIVSEMLVDGLSIYSGAKGPFQKFTCQFISNNKINSYAKISSNKLTISRLENERFYLNKLNNYTLHDFEVPRCIEFVQQRNEVILFLTPYTGDNSKLLRSFAPAHINTLIELFLIDNKFRNLGSYLNDYHNNLLNCIKNYEFLFGKGIIILIEESVSKLKLKYGQERIVLGLSHGDFSPWNVFFNNDKLFVFDWELAGYRVPFWDMFNFIFHSEFSLSSDKEKHILNLLSNKNTRNYSYIQQYCMALKIDDGLWYNIYFKIFLVELLLFYLEYQKQEHIEGFSANSDIIEVIRILKKLLMIINEIKN